MENKKNEGIYPIEKEQKMLKASYDMYEKTINDTKERMETAINNETGDRQYSDEDIEDRIRLIREAEADIISKYIENGGNESDLKAGKTKKKTRKSGIKEKLEKNEILDKMISEEIINSEESKVKRMKDFMPSKKSFDDNVSFDIIPLPSKGECYSSKTDKIPVSYLTAYDENIIVSPNLYKDKMVLDYILSEKIMSDDIDPDLLIEGDREAIILYLRAAGYGNEYPVSAVDDETGERFDAVIDLSEIKFKDFNLKGDEHGFFDYELPVSKHKIKFKFLNHSDNKKLGEITDLERKNAYKSKIEDISEELGYYLDDIDEMASSDRKKAREAINGIKEWAKSLKEDDGLPYSRFLTNKLEMEIVSVDGDTDRKHIRDFVRNMNVKDSSKLRKYIKDNEPGLDYNMTIQKPESLGGGSMEIFLEFDQYIFLNISR